MKKILAMVCLLAFLCCTAAFAEEAAAPKYVFLFIGDGMGNPVVTAAQYFKGAVENPDAPSPVAGQLSFTQFPHLGLMTTYDATSYIPDSAATATAMSTGVKVYSETINYTTNMETTLTPMTVHIKNAGKKVGVITSVSLDHATPAAFYAHAKNRLEYDVIAPQGVNSPVLDLWGGGSFLAEKKDELLTEAAGKGWNIVRTPEAVRALNADSGRTMIVCEDVQSDSSLYYEIDRARMEQEGKDLLSLKEMVEAAIRVLDGDEGFFLMCEGGKIDWASHANDAATAIREVIGLSDAVQVAVDFAAKHPEETLIVVLADHETGGMTIGYAGTGYNTNLQYLAKQTMSFQAYSEKVAEMKKNNTVYRLMLEDVEANYGLTITPEKEMTLTRTERKNIESAYTLSVRSGRRPAGAHLLYGKYDPLTVVLTRIMNNKAGIDYTTFAHTGEKIPVYAMGNGAERFSGLYDNTQIFHRMMEVMGITPAQ